MWELAVALGWLYTMRFALGWVAGILAVILIGRRRAHEFDDQGSDEFAPADRTSAST
jgi:hypothetical protein